MAELVKIKDAESAFRILSNTTEKLDAVHYDASQVFSLTLFEKELKLLKKYISGTPYIGELKKKAIEAMPRFENVSLKLEYLRSNPDYADEDNKEQCAE